MDLITRILYDIGDEERRKGQSQCFVGHQFRQEDLRENLEAVLHRLGLEACFADREVPGGYRLDKICKRILGMVQDSRELD
jgi:hypothetical protein